MPVIEGAGKVGGSGGRGRPQTIVAAYDFAKQGGAIGAIVLAGEQVPAGAIIIDTLIDVQTIPASAGAATIAVTAESAGDIQAASAITGEPWLTAGPKRGAVGTPSPPVKATVKRTITVVLAAAALTAGKFRAVVTYVEIA